jgi:hypothetical protein
LSVGDAQVTQDPQIFGSLYALRYQLASEYICNLLKCLNRLELVAVLADVLGEIFVNFDNLGFEL